MADQTPQAPKATYGGCVPKPKKQWLAERPQNQPYILRTFESPEALEEACAIYFTAREADGNRPTWSGLALHLGMESRQQLWTFVTGQVEGVTEAWVLPLKRAASRIEARHEERLYDPACAGAIFALKQRGWTDTTQTQAQPGSVSISVALQVVQGERPKARAAVQQTEWFEPEE